MSQVSSSVGEKVAKIEMLESTRNLRGYIALSLCEEILAFSHAFGSLAVRRVAL